MDPKPRVKPCGSVDYFYHQLAGDSISYHQCCGGMLTVTKMEPNHLHYPKAGSLQLYE